MVYNTLNRLKWTGKLDGCEIMVLHRGAENDKKIISGDKITEVRKTYFSYDNGREEVTIPFHRVLEITVDERIIWKRKHN